MGEALTFSGSMGLGQCYGGPPPTYISVHIGIYRQISGISEISVNIGINIGKYR